MAQLKGGVMARLFLVFLICAAIPSAAAAGSWSVSETNEEGGTVYVEVTLDVDLGGCAPGIGCAGSEFARLQVTPCPLNQTCSGDTYDRVMTSNVFTQTIVLELSAATMYTFNGSWSIQRKTFDIYTNDCTLTFCQAGGQLDPVTFPDPIAAEATTWGRIKSLYR